MKKFDFDSGFVSGIPDYTKMIPKEKREEIKEKFRSKVDEIIAPDSELGDKIKKGRRFLDRKEEKEENRKNAPKNLFHSGEKKKSFELADHLFIRNGVYTHHAIYIGNGRVIHYSTNSEGKITIHSASLEEFSEGREIFCLSERESPLKYSRSEAVGRAIRRQNEHKYELIGNNCEDFVRWCRNGGKEEVWEDN